MTGVAEALTVLWRVMDGNRKFVSYLVETERASELLVWLVVVCLEFKDDEGERKRRVSRKLVYVKSNFARDSVLLM